MLLSEAWATFYELKEIQPLTVLLHHHLEEVLIFIGLEQLHAGWSISNWPLHTGIVY